MNYSSNNSQQLEPSYGNYWQQQPMKVFAGQPNWATQQEVNILDRRVDHLEKEMNSEYNNSSGNSSGKNPCDRCPKSEKDCKSLSNETAQTHCMQMLTQCQKNC